MSSHEEAVDMVNYYKQQPASLYGKPISFYLSKTLLVIEVRAAVALTPLTRRNALRYRLCPPFDPQKDERSRDRQRDRPLREVKGHRSQVIFFSNLPIEEEKKKELLTIARRFGVVEKHLFLTDQVLILVT